MGVGAATLLLGVPYLLRLQRLSEELETVTALSIHKITLNGLELRVEVRMKNPTGGTLKVKHPFVKMLYGDKTFATSQVKDTNYTLPKFGEVSVDPIFVNLSFFTLGQNVPDLLKEYRKTGNLSVVVKTITTINDRIPYTKTDTLTI